MKSNDNIFSTSHDRHSPFRALVQVQPESLFAISHSGRYHSSWKMCQIGVRYPEDRGSDKPRHIGIEDSDRFWKESPERHVLTMPSPRSYPSSTSNFAKLEMGYTTNPVLHYYRNRHTFHSEREAERTRLSKDRSQARWQQVPKFGFLAISCN